MAPLWDCVMPLYITETLIMGSGIVGIVYSCDSIFSAAAALLLGKRADKCKATKLFAVCCALMLVLSLLICILESKTVVLFAVFIVLGIVFSAASPVLEKIESTAIHETFTGFDYALISLSVGAGAAVGNALALVKVLICAGVPLLRVYTFFCNGKRSDRSVYILCRFSIFGRRRIKMLFHFSGKMAYVAKARVFRNLVHR